MSEPRSSSVDGSFPATRWSLILRARDGGERTAGAALEALCRTYWVPVYAFVRGRGHSPHDAEDLTQGFFEDLLGRPFLSRVSPEKGRFRSFLLASVKNYLAKDHRRASAGKRGGGAISVDIDIETIEARCGFHGTDHATPEVVYERQWVLALLDSVLSRLEREYRDSGRGDLFEALRDKLVSDTTAPGYRELAEQLGMEEGALKVAAHRLRKRYREALRSAVADTVDSDEEIERELDHLMAVFRRG